ncbi:hypothetical protein CAJAP_01289 [Camponotus japonicus]
MAHGSSTNEHKYQKRTRPIAILVEEVANAGYSPTGERRNSNEEDIIGHNFTINSNVRKYSNEELPEAKNNMGPRQAIWE